ITYIHSKWPIIVSGPPPPYFYTLHLYIYFPLRITMNSSLNKSRIILTLKAIKNDPKLSVQKAASIYNILRITL
ncbi:hypothetical protein CSPAE12_11031, partial [Colletotrichum incanum]